MTIRIAQLTLPATEDLDQESLRGPVAKYLGIDPQQISRLSIVKKSLDARKKSQVVHHYRIDCDCQDENQLVASHKGVDWPPSPKPWDFYQDITQTPQPRHPPVIIGTGPAGIFAALALEGRGVPAILVERGEAVEGRIRSVNTLRRRGTFDEESHLCYGEGGAGSFSDGKLTCGRNHPYIKLVFDHFVRYGAPEAILYDSHPHIGTDKLVRIAQSMRLRLKASGFGFRFQSRFLSFRSGGRHAKYLVQLSTGEELATDHLILAIGHSARDTYTWLHQAKVAMEPKPFAIGARIEHPQALINNIQYGSQCQLSSAAEYKLTARVKERGIWTFCMCPGGHLLPTGAQEGHLAINGMSYHNRNSGYANAAVVVNVLREDFYQGHPLDGMHFQSSLERQAFAAGGSNYCSPGQRLKDFLNGRPSKGLIQSTYKPGVENARMDKVLPDFVVESLRAALSTYNQKMPGYLSDQASVIGLESKTSAPVILPRSSSLESISHPGLYPCGEGAGFAGGIISAALDGLKVGQAVLRSLG